MPFDILIFIIVLVVAFFGVLYFGKSLGVSAIISFYPTTLIYNSLPYTEKILSYARNDRENLLLKIALFTIILLIVYLAMRKAVSVVFSWTPILKLLDAVVLSIVLTGVTFASYTSALGTESFISNPPLNYLFNFPNYLFWWLSGGILVLLFTLKK